MSLRLLWLFLAVVRLSVRAQEPFHDAGRSTHVDRPPSWSASSQVPSALVIPERPPSTFARPPQRLLRRTTPHSGSTPSTPPSGPRAGSPEPVPFPAFGRPPSPSGNDLRAGHYYVYRIVGYDARGQLRGHLREARHYGHGAWTEDPEPLPVRDVVRWLPRACAEMQQILPFFRVSAMPAVRDGLPLTWRQREGLLQQIPRSVDLTPGEHELLRAFLAAYRLPPNEPATKSKLWKPRKGPK